MIKVFLIKKKLAILPDLVYTKVARFYSMFRGKDKYPRKAKLNNLRMRP